MIPRKKLSIPVARKSFLHYSVSDLKDCALVLKHMKPSNGALVCAEGIVSAGFDVPASATALFGTGSDLKVYVKDKKQLHGMISGTFCGSLPNLKEVINYALEDGTDNHFATGTYTYRIDKGTTYLIGTLGGNSIAVFKERLFVAGKRILRWSAIFKYENLVDDETQMAGSVQFPDEESGIFIKLVPIKDTLYLFRERGLLKITAYADTLNFKAVPMPYACGQIIQGSVARCGDNVYFLTENGLCVFDGNVCAHVPNAGEGLIDLTKAVHGFCCKGEYFAHVTGKDGVRRLFAFDPGFGYGRYLEIEAVDASVYRKVYVLKNNDVYAVEGKALPASGKCVADMRFSLGKLRGNRKVLESIAVEGQGMFEIEASANGTTRRAKGPAGRRLPLNAALCGEEIDLKITVKSKDFALRAVTLGIRREDIYED